MSKAFSIAALATMIGLSVFGNVGCAENAPKKPAATPPPEHAVIVDFYRGSKVSSACSGTLISSNVVLTAAHCAEGSSSARVTSPTTKQKALVKRIYRYDWRWGGSAQHHEVEHDLALVVLRTPIKIQKYATLESSDCTGCKISRVGRVRTKSAIRTTLKSSAVMRVGKNHPASRPFDLYVPRGSMDAGGALVRTDAKGRGRVVGVMIGTGGLSHGGYAARLDEAPVQAWIRGITYSVRLKSTTSTTVSTKKSIRPLDADEDTGGEASEPEPEEAPAEEPTDDETTSSSSSEADTNPYENDPSNDTGSGSDEQQQQQQQTNDAPPSQDEQSNTGQDEEQKKEPNEQPEAPEKEDVTPGGQTNNPGQVDNSETSTTDVETKEPSGESNTDPNTNGDNTKTEEEKKSEEPTTKVDGAKEPEKTYEDPVLKSGTDKKGFAYTDTDNAAVKFKTNTAADRELKERADAYAANNKNANIVSTHGSPGWMEAPPTDKKLKQFGSNGKPIVMASCFAAEPPINGGKTNAQSIAEKAGIPPEKVYGCNGVVGPDSNSMRCDGTWRDATGKELGVEQRREHGLENCSQVPAPGKPGYVIFTCQPN